MHDGRIHPTRIEEIVENVKVKAIEGGAPLAPAADEIPGQLVYRFSSPYPYLDGKVDDFRIYSGALGAEDVATLAKAPRE